MTWDHWCNPQGKLTKQSGSMSAKFQWKCQAAQCREDDQISVIASCSET